MLLRRTGRHEDALKLFVHDMGELEMAKRYLKSVLIVLIICLDDTCWLYSLWNTASTDNTVNIHARMTLGVALYPRMSFDLLMCQ